MPAVQPRLTKPVLDNHDVLVDIVVDAIADVDKILPVDYLGLLRVPDRLAGDEHTGDVSESVWLDILNKYLPKRYKADKAHVVDSQGTFSDQIDVVVYDAQYSPPIFLYECQTIVPAESVYAVFEAKQTLNAEHIGYARRKVASVRRLHRTSLPIPHAGGTYAGKPPGPICGGLLALNSDWRPPLGEPLLAKIGSGGSDDCLDLGCVAAREYFKFDGEKKKYETYEGGKPATAFLFTLISQLQSSGTVSMIDMQAYAQWLD